MNNASSRLKCSAHFWSISSSFASVVDFLTEVECFFFLFFVAVSDLIALFSLAATPKKGLIIAVIVLEKEHRKQSRVVASHRDPLPSACHDTSGSVACLSIPAIAWPQSTLL